MGIWFYVIFAVCMSLMGLSIVSTAHFRGASAVIENLLTVFNLLAAVAALVLCVSMFWVAPWWVPFVMLLGAWLLGGLFAHIGMTGNGFIALICVLLYTIGFVVLFYLRFA